ncbi:coenzyme A transferase [Anopheles sinensis]|uniref:Coenzyme A transferase n=1 Tax=Anopheles sinensis TaxID=74873 RepID=A0A084W278_ANOSI|nr:coenzyme A transferase [Anopheles sinensis]
MSPKSYNDSLASKSTAPTPISQCDGHPSQHAHGPTNLPVSLPPALADHRQEQAVGSLKPFNAIQLRGNDAQQACSPFLPLLFCGPLETDLIRNK